MGPRASIPLLRRFASRLINRWRRVCRSWEAAKSSRKSDGEPRWDDPATIVVPVKLKPNHDYWLSINNDRFQNFTNQAGESATPYPIKFRTGRGQKWGQSQEIGCAAKSEAQTSIAKANRHAVELLQSDIRDHYSYRDRLHLDWDAVVQEPARSR